MFEANEIGVSVEEVRMFLRKGYEHNEEEEIQAFEKGRGRD
ncbi:hypothetical protein J2S13_003256 [Oikeobacillus pervagus]|uniref:Sin domain-containing protein n=1 Tax=Oikeobacillus pervagus TaxID=1325931 RepID=A0AAJ1T4T9_9BACI|nr:hypothetical protein [Oikeobacillus pervagus]MDQ0216772.1 hypothetical protein [Oikeobacillus pervagus]